MKKSSRSYKESIKVSLANLSRIDDLISQAATNRAAKRKLNSLELFRQVRSTQVLDGNNERRAHAFRISPDMAIALRTTLMGPNEKAETESVQIVASRHPSPEEVDAYERVLGDALAGDAPFSRASIMSKRRGES